MLNRPEPQRRLFDEASQLNHQLDPQSICDLYDLIQAPSSLQAFFVHIPLLPAIFKVAIETAGISGYDDIRYQSAAKAAAILHDLLPYLEDNDECDDFQAPGFIQRFGPCEGILNTYPLYSFLAERVVRQEYRARFVLLQANVILAMEQRGNIQKEQDKDLHAAFKYLRKLGAEPNWKFLAPLPTNAVSLSDFGNTVRSCFRNTEFQPVTYIFSNVETPRHEKSRVMAFPGKERNDNIIHTVKQDFEVTASIVYDEESSSDAQENEVDEHSVKSEEVTKVAQASAKNKRNVSHKKKYHLDEEEESSEKYIRDINQTSVLKEKEASQYILHGGRPDELVPDIGFEPVLPKNKLQGQTLRQLAYQARQANNDRAMRNQFCSLAWNQANLYDLKILFDFLKENHIPEFDFSPLTSTEAAVLMGLSFFTCNPFERLLSLPVYFNASPQPQSLEGLYFHDTSLPVVRLHSPGPTLTDREELPGALKVGVYSTIPLPPFLANILTTPGGPFGSGRSRSHLFDAIDPNDAETKDEIHSLLRRIMGHLNKDAGSRLSPGRIKSYLLFRAAEKMESDLPGAMLFFGRDDKIVRTRLHYTVSSTRHLEMIYRQCCNELLETLNCSGQFDLDAVSNTENYLGTPFCPTPDTVKGIAKDLQEALVASAELTLHERHNLYSLYTSMLIAYGTGFRAIRDPSFQEIEIDVDYGIGIVCDKGEAKYHTRYVYLAPVVLAQIEFYRQHIQVIYRHLGVTNPSLFDMVKDLDYEGLPLSLFWLDNELSPVELLAPGKTEKILSNQYNYVMRPNCDRHYLKYRLIHAGCSPELIEAQLGHWENGQEAWGRFSNLDPLEFIEQMASYIPQIMADDGWRAVKGLG